MMDARVLRFRSLLCRDAELGPVGVFEKVVGAGPVVNEKTGSLQSSDELLQA
jgi:hypothetical protein